MNPFGKTSTASTKKGVVMETICVPIIKKRIIRSDSWELFNSPGGALNSRLKIKCKSSFLCKRMTCSSCQSIRRARFVKYGLKHCQMNQLSTHLIITWKKASFEKDPWQELLSSNRILSQSISSKRAGHFIKVISLSMENKTPHVHYVVSKSTAKKITRVSREKWRNNLVICEKLIKKNQIENVLGYLFDRNYIPSILDSERPKGVRLLTASRPMKTGFFSGYGSYQKSRLNSVKQKDALEIASILKPPDIIKQYAESCVLSLGNG